MIIVDTALAAREQRNAPIRVALIGAGYMGRGFVNQLLTPLVGMRLVAVANRTRHRVERIVEERTGGTPRTVTSCGQLDGAIAAGELVVADDYRLLCESESVDVLIEATGQIEFGAEVALAAIAARKNLVMVNAELDATVGPLLHQRARAAGIVLTNTDGDEPAVAHNLVRFARTLGYQPVLAGNIKGFIDVHRNPDTQAGFAKNVGQDARMITSFADGTKLSMEATLLANATGLRVSQRGMRGPKCEHVRDIIQHFSAEELLECPLVDYALGAQPGTGAFVVGYNAEPIKQEYMRYFKMGEGPLYVLYTPFHLPQIEITTTIARAALFADAAVAARGAPVCDVAATAKKRLRAGETLDGIGGFTCYGQIENYDTSREENYLPMGLTQGCRLVRDVEADEPLRYYDVELPAGLGVTLRQEMEQTFPSSRPRAVATASAST